MQKTRKRLLAGGLLLCLLCAVLPAFAQDQITDDWAWRLNEDGQVIIVKYLGHDPIVHMDWHIDYRVIAEIGEGAFAENPTLRQVVLPVGVHTLRTEAFRDCPALESVLLPERLETMEDRAFRGCTALPEMILPAALVEMGEDCFEPTLLLLGDENSLAESYARANGMAWEYYSETKTAEKVIPHADFAYEAYGDGLVITAYYGDEFRLTVPAEIDGKPVLKIGMNAFSSCYSLQTVVLPEGLKELDENAFRFCREMYAITLPSTLERIGANAFYRCERLESVSIPGGVREVGDRAFTQCHQLRDVWFTSGTEKIPNYTFFECSPYFTIHAPAGSAAQAFAQRKGYAFVVTEE